MSRKNKILKEDEAKEISIKLTHSDKILIAAIITVILLFGLFIGGYWLVRNKHVKTIDELHQDNMKGKLGNEEGYVYNGFSFVKANGMWFTQLQKLGTNNVYNVQFHYSPRDLESVSLLGNVSDFTSLNGTYVSFDPSEKDFTYTALASGELSINLGHVLGILPVAACSKNLTVTCFSRPIVDCTKTDRPVIYMERADEAAVIRENAACIRVMGNTTGIVKATDRLLYQWFGIMK
jgi:hypothetical protein